MVREILVLKFLIGGDGIAKNPCMSNIILCNGPVVVGDDISESKYVLDCWLFLGVQNVFKLLYEGVLFSWKA